MTRETILLEAGQALTVTADANSSGSVARVREPGSSAQYAAEAVAASSSVAVGPFSAPRRYAIQSDTGALTYAVAVAEPTATSAGLAASLPDETGTGKAMFNTAPVVEGFIEITAGDAPSAPSTGVRLFVVEVDGLKVLKARFPFGTVTIATDPD